MLFRSTPCSLQGIDDLILETEVLHAISSMTSDKAPGPDGFTGAFFKSCWTTIKSDIMRVINLFSNLHGENFHWLNSAFVALLPKKEGAEGIGDFRSISLIHAIAKIISKVLALRLTPHMNVLVSNAQSAFIRTRSIHDNFLFVRNFARRLHRNKSPSLLFKLDIKKAFDSIRWDYIIDLLRHLGFPNRFLDWLSILLSTASSRIILNGVPGDPIRHGRGLRQGDPLSPLFLSSASTPFSSSSRWRRSGDSFIGSMGESQTFERPLCGRRGDLFEAHCGQCEHSCLHPCRFWRGNRPCH